MIGEYRGRTWDYDGDVRVLRAKGLEDLVRNAAEVTGGFDGGVPTPSFMPPGTFVLELLVLADSDEDMATKQADIRAACWSEDSEAEFPFRFTMRGGAPLTVFAKVVNRSVPTDFDTNDRYQACVIALAFECPDPFPYLDAITTTLAAGDSVEIADGYASTRRWIWTIDGTATDARLTVSTDGYPDQTVRCTGSAHDLVVESYSNDLVTTVDGEDAFGDFDNGASSAARFPRLAPGQTVAYDAAGTPPAAELTYWPACP